MGALDSSQKGVESDIVYRLSQSQEPPKHMEQGRMNNSVSIFCVVGTRPEAIKMAPVILALKQTIWARVKVIATAQHRGIMDEALELFGVVPDIDLDLMRPDQQLSDLTSRLLSALDTVFRSERPDADSSTRRHDYCVCNGPSGILSAHSLLSR